MKQIVIPDIRLQPYVKHFIIEEKTNASIYKVLPGTSIVIGIQYKGSLKKVNGKAQDTLATAGITGLQQSCNYFLNNDYIGTILIIFTATGAATFFKTPMHELYNHSYSLTEIVLPSVVRKLQEQLYEATNHSLRIKIIECFLFEQLQEKQKDKIVEEAVKLISISKGAIRTKELADKLYISQSRFEKRFRAIVGTSPKKYASLIRINNIINQPVKNLTKLSYDAGYFDQAHFIKDFKQHTGMTPYAFFSQIKSSD